MLKAVVIDVTKAPNEKQLKILDKMQDRDIVMDDECPGLTDEQLEVMCKIAMERKAACRKETVTLRLSPQALKTAKALGKGYTSILSRILEGALADKEVLKNYL